ncbi:carboxylate/amino acid/amine transporter [Thalassovita gelatinovora]|uniref:Carboxylate/amino acid/amine transporter n=1 Tax=Thalassovita gelatinovora TaxID=53501 RepID=A0A0P1FNN9_THAGE|nr:DMT family transporter [Thalassovita gelatinovora]QIZ79394.1 DMT family transporter [Thalassovita gelatinovora]CUH62719.1 carboxylate/amino acid/amine transporter [Thalassovita gelatinovora]SEQ09050.1 Permease of the drug/metabolite transporter (DMT) superfamily [Thalassovita gelatinovora]
MLNVKANLLFTLSMALFAVQDLFVKQVTATIPTSELIFFLGIGGTTMFGLVAIRSGETLFPPLRGHGILYLRSVSEGFCAVFVIVSLSAVPLATFATMFQAVPLVVTMGAALFLREQVGWRRWLAILIGFGGVLLIIRPGSAEFEVATLLVVGAVVSISLRDVISRRLPATVSTSVVSFQGFSALLLAGPILGLLQQHQPVLPSVYGGIGIGAAIGLGIAGYAAMVVAMRIGEVSSLAPFRYSRMVFSMALGIVFLHERPDLLTYAGAALIIATGLYTFLRERRLARKTTQSQMSGIA